MRANNAASAVPSDNDGNTSDAKPSSAPDGGNIRSFSENTRMSSGASQKRGTATPTSANVSATAPSARPRRHADNTPRPTPTTMATTRAANASFNVLGSR